MPAAGLGDGPGRRADRRRQLFLSRGGAHPGADQRPQGRHDRGLDHRTAGATALATTVSASALGDVSFNGSQATFTGQSSSATFGAAPNSLNSLTYEGTCAEAEDTGAGDPSVIVTPGIPDETVTIEAVGSVTLAQGDVGPLTVAWNDGGTIGSGDYWEVMTAKDGGQEDGEITCEYTFKRRKSASA